MIEKGEEFQFQQVSRIQESIHVTFQIRKDSATKSAVVWFSYDNGAIEVCDYMCVCGFYLTPMGPPFPSSLPLHLQPSLLSLYSQE